MANEAGPSTTPAASFSFGSNAVGTAASGVTETFQFAAPNTESTVSLKPQPLEAAGLFQFAATTAAAAVTSATTQLPVSSGSEAVKPFVFNAGSTTQGFSFVSTQSSGTAGGLQSTFDFGAPKREATFAGFAPAQPSSSQQTVSLLPLNNFLMAARLILSLLCFLCCIRLSCVYTQ